MKSKRMGVIVSRAKRKSGCSIDSSLARGDGLSLYGFVYVSRVAFHHLKLKGMRVQLFVGRGRQSIEPCMRRKDAEWVETSKEPASFSCLLTPPTAVLTSGLRLVQTGQVVPVSGDWRHEDGRETTRRDGKDHNPKERKKVYRDQ